MGLLPGIPAHKALGKPTAASSAWKPSRAELSRRSPACLVQIWIGLIKRPQQQPDFCPAVSLAGAWRPQLCLPRESKCNTRNLHTSDRPWGWGWGWRWNKLGTALSSSFHSQLQSEAIRGDSLSPMSTSPPCHSLLYPEIYNHSVTAAMHSHVPGPGSRQTLLSSP